MVIINKQGFLRHKEKYLAFLNKGRACIYPTDTIYGIGCDATNTKAVKHIYHIKRRKDKPLSIIAPSKQWILDNCIINARVKKWIAKLPGKYTLILKLKNKKAVSKLVHLGDYTVGVRIPKHWFSRVVAQYGKPFVTTSVNISGKASMTSLSDVHANVKEQVAFIIFEGIKAVHPSVLIDLRNDCVKKTVRNK